MREDRVASEIASGGVEELRLIDQIWIAGRRNGR